MANIPQFIHLRVHTEHSLLEGAVPVKKLVDLCGTASMPAVAVTDTNNMFAALEFSDNGQGGRRAADHRLSGVAWRMILPAPVRSRAPLPRWCCWRRMRRAIWP